jgi:hypothetical protein
MCGISAILSLDGSPEEAFEERLHAAVKVRRRSRDVPCAIA